MSSRRTRRTTLTALTFSMVAWLLLPATAFADDDMGTVFFRGAWAGLSSDRGGEVFTDTAEGLGAGPANDGDSGFSVGAGLDLRLMDEGEMVDFAEVLGEIYVEYARFSNERVVQTASALLGAPVQRSIAVSELAVVIAPKLRFKAIGPVRPFVIPVGMAFLVNSPPSDNASYLDIGLHFAGGAEVELGKSLGLGADVRYNLAFDQSDTENSYLSAGGYLAIYF